MILADQLFNLIQEVSSRLPSDIEMALKKSALPSKVFSVIDQTICISRDKKVPICQDTGLPYFYLKLPYCKADRIREIESAIEKAIEKATESGILRPNSVDPLSGNNPGNNLGIGLPYIDWEFVQGHSIECCLLLKGGGSENASAQYSLPLGEINAGRDMKGIVNTVLHHLHKIQGQGCAPGIIGIGIGGDRSLSMKIAKKQLFRELNDSNPDQELAEIEEEILKRGNMLEIGPMGLGGNPTLLGVKAGKVFRHPASFFVSISYLCWVARRGKCLLDTN